MNITNEELRKQYKLMADFLGYKYYPYDKEGPRQNRSYPGWFKIGKENYPNYIVGQEQVIPYKSSLFISRNTLALNFKHNWNMLMKVVDKIETIKSQKYGSFKVVLEGDVCTIYSSNKTKLDAYSKSYYSGDKANSAYFSTLHFIEWYNTINKK